MFTQTTKVSHEIQKMENEEKVENQRHEIRYTEED